MKLEILSFGDDKVQAVKIIREITGWGLKEAKDFVDNTDKEIWRKGHLILLQN